MKKRLIVAACLVTAAFFIHYFFLSHLTLANIKMHGNGLRSFVEHNYLLSVAIYLTVYIFGAIIALPIAALLTVIGGFLFGVFYTIIFATIGATLGATGAFLLTRYLLGNWLQARYARAFTRFNNEVELYGTSYFLSVRLVAVIPFFLVNVLAGLTRVRLPIFIATTCIGVIPVECIFAFAGSQLAMIESLGDIVSFKMICALLLLAILALSPVFFKKIGNFVKRSS